MNGKYLLDTNIIIALFAGEVQVHARLRECPAVFISAISVGELVLCPVTVTLDNR